MRNIGFSTGALAYGDFRRGIELQQVDGITAVELSALRETELESLIEALPRLDLSRFSYRSFHAPSSLSQLSNAQLVDRLRPAADQGLPIVLHPDVIGTDFEPWRALADMVLLENMDGRKKVCQSASELDRYFDYLPDARFCFDIGHAHQVDPTMGVAVELLLRHHDRLAEIHISEVNWACKHRPISSVALLAFRRVVELIPEHVPIIIESVLNVEDNPECIQRELDMVGRVFEARLSPSFA